MNHNKNTRRVLELIEKRDYDTIIKENEKLIYFAMGRFKIDENEKQDITQECRIILYKCAISFDPNKGEFSTIAIHSIFNTIKLYYRNKNIKEKIYTNSISLDTNLDSDEGELDATLGCIIEDKKLETLSIYKKGYLYREILNAINSMKSVKKREIMFLFLFDKNFDRHNLAQKYNINYGTINSTIYQAKKQMQKYLISKGIDSNYFD